MYYYQFNIGDYISHTRHLTLSEDAVYRRLLDAYYLQEHPLNVSVSVVARQINARDYENEVFVILEEFFELTDDGWVNVRADKEIAKYHAKAEQASKAGKASAKARSNKHSTDVANQLNKNLTDEQLNIKQETINNKQIKDIRPSDVTVSIWQDFVSHRKAKKAPITETVLNTIRTEANKANWKLDDALTEICSRGWTGFKAEWVNKTQDSRPVFDGRLRGAK
jgi:uncharacterized protein YdaU (DUF1376 family)